MNYKLLFAVFFFSTQASFADSSKESPQSGEGSTEFGVTISAIGIDKENESITGFYHLLNNSMPGRSFHADCKIIFSGKLSNNSSISICANSANKPSPKAIGGKLFLMANIAILLIPHENKNIG